MCISILSSLRGPYCYCKPIQNYFSTFRYMNCDDFSLKICHFGEIKRNNCFRNALALCPASLSRKRLKKESAYIESDRMRRLYKTRTVTCGAKNSTRAQIFNRRFLKNNFLVCFFFFGKLSKPIRPRTLNEETIWYGLISKC